MKRSFPVVDADGHVIERNRELKEFLRRRIAESRRGARQRARCLRTLNVEL
jgi:hypothetical protein